MAGDKRERKAKKPKYLALKQLEESTGRIVSIRPRIPADADHHEEYQEEDQEEVQKGDRRELHFFTLPPELRLAIYELVLEPLDDPNAPYKQSALYWRPEYQARHKTDYSILLTCRQIWLEACELPLKLATHPFWFHNGPHDLERLKWSAAVQAAAPEDAEKMEKKRVPSEVDRYQGFFKRLTPLNLTQLNHIQIFASCAWLPPNHDGLNIGSYFNKDWFAAKKLTITIRHSEWEVWDKMDPEKIDIQWIKALLNHKSLKLRTLCLELEMNIEKAERLDSIAARYSALDGKAFVRHGDVEKGHWTKSTVIASLQDDMGLLNELQAVASFLTRIVTWKSTSTAEGRHQYPRGFVIKDGGLQDFQSARQRFKTRARKRGGRRSMAVWYRNHWQPRYSNEEELAELVRQDTAAQLMEQWAEDGSLLRLVRVHSLSFVRRHYTTSPKESWGLWGWVGRLGSKMDILR